MAEELGSALCDAKLLPALHARDSLAEVHRQQARPRWEVAVLNQRPDPHTGVLLAPAAMYTR